MRTTIALVCAVLLAGCGRMSVRDAAQSVAEAPSTPGAIAALVLQVLESGDPPTYDVIGDTIVDCVDAYEDRYPATSDIMRNLGDQLSCVCWHDWIKRITFERPGYVPNPMFERTFCQPAPAVDMTATTVQQSVTCAPTERPSVAQTVEPPAVDPECAATYGAEHFMCVDRSEWVK